MKTAEENPETGRGVQVLHVLLLISYFSTLFITHSTSQPPMYKCMYKDCVCVCEEKKKKERERVRDPQIHIDDLLYCYKIHVTAEVLLKERGYPNDFLY